MTVVQVNNGANKIQRHIKLNTKAYIYAKKKKVVQISHNDCSSAHTHSTNS